MLLGFLVYKLGGALYPSIPARTGLVQDLPAKVLWFLLEPFPNALNAVLLSPSHWISSREHAALSFFHKSTDMVIAWSIFVAILGGLVLYFPGTLKERM